MFHLLLVLAVGCRAPEPVTSTPLPASTPAPTGPTVIDGTFWLAAPTIVEVHTGPGIRDLEAVLAGPGTFRWLEDGVDAGLVDVPVPAHRVWPGATWTVVAALEDGRTGEATHVVPEPPGGNVLVLLLDDVGVDKVGAYGGPYASPTPRIDGLAATGVRFTRAYASPVCSPTRGTLMTGRQPRRTGLGWIADTGTRDITLPLAATIVPEALWEARSLASWSDGAIGKWHMAGPEADGFHTHPNDSGFSWFAGPLGNPEYSPDRGYYAWTKNVNGLYVEVEGYMSTVQVDDALARVAAMPEPWFLYVAFNAPHTPLNLPPAELLAGPLPGEGAATHERYDAVLEALDTEIGRLLDGIPSAVLGRTTVIVAGDNGTSDHGVPPDWDLGRNKHTPYEGGVRVPLVVSGPHVTSPGSVSGALVHVSDVLPTVADLAGVPLGGPDGGVLDLADGPVPLDGRSLLPFLADPDAPGRTWVYAEAHTNGAGPTYGTDRRALRDLTHKLVHRQASVELYRLEGPDEIDVTDLLADGQPLSVDDQAALDRLSDVMAELELDLVYEGF